MATDLMYKPNTQEIYIGDKQVSETRGLWEVSGQFMAGPFLNYMIEIDEGETLVLDGFVYSPGTNKRNYIFELEAIIRSVRF